MSGNPNERIEALLIIQVYLLHKLSYKHAEPTIEIPSLQSFLSMISDMVDIVLS